MDKDQFRRLIRRFAEAGVVATLEDIDFYGGDELEFTVHWATDDTSAVMHVSASVEDGRIVRVVPSQETRGRSRPSAIRARSWRVAARVACWDHGPPPLDGRVPSSSLNIDAGGRGLEGLARTGPVPVIKSIWMRSSLRTREDGALVRHVGRKLEQLEQPLAATKGEAELLCSQNTMEESRKRAKASGDDGESVDASSSQKEPPASDVVNAAMNIVELQARMETMRVNRELEMDELKAQCRHEADELSREEEAEGE
ncbi:hypothetical protein THAOC_03783 [Thalassiosira oceanica]|uniref:Uncharacterized protein n=1 Tax=Thalassiosira oceanica TaxID=159749 RepID=K0T6W4_THAOC|nr:hypothetical protein THAOC_03783 [Thalassiosira oceanica]|eukprot:EJK74533.1 hypothetical protein THAOC_03783 [Thalassiosira oceanica]